MSLSLPKGGKMNLKNLLTLVVGIGLSFLLVGCEGWIIITPGNQPPIAVISANPTQGYAKLFVEFDASASYDPDGQIVSYNWDFGDGSTGEGVVLNHVFQDDSDFNNDGQQEGYLVTLTLTDDFGSQASTSITIIVYNPPPIAEFSWQPRKPYTFETVTFDASASYDPAALKPMGVVIEPSMILFYYWDFGDGTSGEGKTVSHAYYDNGNYTVTLTVTDDDYFSVSKSQIIDVLNRSPIADFTWHDCVVTTPFGSQPEGIIFTHCIEFDASGSKDPDGWLIGYYWDFGDGAVGYGEIVQHYFVDSNIYTIKLVVTDNDGASSQKEVRIRV